MPQCAKCKSKSTYEDGHIHHVKGCEYWDKAPEGRVSLGQTEFDLLSAKKEGAMLGIGWAYADCCVTLDDGKDPRKTEMPTVLSRAVIDLEL